MLKNRFPSTIEVSLLMTLVAPYLRNKCRWFCKRGFILLAVSFLLIPSAKSEAFTLDSLWEHIYQNFDFLPEYHLEADILMFLFHKNSFFKERYYLESNTNLEFVFISFRDFLNSVWSFEFQSGMGQTPGNVVFDPMDLNYGIVPSIEFRTPLLNLQTGLNHHCFHEIDRNDFKTVYWNKLFLAVGSKNMRHYDYWQLLSKSDGWNPENRISWYLAWGYYLRKFFGIVNEHTINGVNKYVHDAKIDLRYAFYRRRSWIVNLRGTSQIGYYKNLEGEPKESGGYWRLDLGIESNFRRGKKGGMIFITYTLDDLPKYQGYPRFSKDKLLQFGVRFFI